MRTELIEAALSVCINYWGEGHIRVIGPDEECSFATTTLSLVPVLLIVGFGVGSILALFVGYRIRRKAAAKGGDQKP